jgi:hypothetical protein
MKFKKEVAQLFAKAGWYTGRNLKAKYDKISHFHELPSFLKEFLYEYGDLKIETYKYHPEDVTGVLDLTLHEKWSESFPLHQISPYGNMKTYSIGYYALDNAICECDDKGGIYMMSDAPTLMSENFIEGIEKVIMEDYTNTLEWHFDVKQWKEERF